jgi:hypothetical protein
MTKHLFNSKNSEDLLMEQAEKYGKDLEFTIRRHMADKAGEHYDLVIGDPKSDFVADFVIPNIDLTKKRLVIPQDLHSTDEYLKDNKENLHVIEKGYGKGTWRTVVKGKAIQNDNKHSFELKSDSFDTYKFYRFKPGNWFIKLE